MNTLKWILLCVVFTIYLLFGGSIIMLLEQGNEITQNEQLSVLRKDVHEILFRLDRDFYQNGTSSDILDAVTAAKEGVLNRISGSCGGKKLLTDENIEDKPLTWTFYNSVFFAFTAVTTIGYGNLTPAVPISRMFTILYALFGIPINGIIISGLSDYYSKRLVKAHKRSKDKSTFDARVVFIFDIIFYLIPGLLVFIVAPAGFFVVIEKWSFLDSIYFCFVTLSTIGFGDYVAGLGDGHSVLLWLYKFIIIIWIMFGLGYLLMILSFITKGMTSKQVRTVIEKRLHGIRSTKEKLSRDIDYMRRVVHELYLLKDKPDYANEAYEIQVEAEINQRKYSTVKYNNRSVRRNVSFNDVDTSGYKKSLQQQQQTPKTMIKSHSESEIYKLDKGGDNDDPKMEDWLISDQIMATLVSAIAGNMNDMIHAVNQLNEYENDLNAEEFDDTNDDEGHKIANVDDLLDEWCIEESDSDKDILIEEDEEGSFISDGLEEIVVEQHDNKPETFMEKIGEALRKISTGNRSGVPSRNVSQNEADRRQNTDENQNLQRDGRQSGIQTTKNSRESRNTSQKGSDNESDEESRKISLNPSPHINPRIPARQPSIHKISSARRISKNSSESSFQRESNDGNLPDTQEFSRNLDRFDSDLKRYEKREDVNTNITDERQRFSLERKSLQELLRALDSVQDRLHQVELPGRATRTSTDNPSEESRPHHRRRKVGIFNPGFSFIDTTFAGKSGDKQHGV